MWSKNERSSSQHYNDETKASNASNTIVNNCSSSSSSSNSTMTATSPAIAVSPGAVTRNDGSTNAAIDIATAARHSLVFPTVHVVEVGSKDNTDDKATKNQTVRFVNNDVIENKSINASSTTSLFQKVANVFGRSQSSDTNKMNINVPDTTATASMFFEEECTSPAVTAAAATTLLPESLTTKPVKHVQVSNETLESIDTITLSSSVSTPTIPSIHNATNDFAHASRSGSSSQYQQAHDDHIPIIPSFVPHLGSHHHVHIPHRHHYIPHRHHVLKKHIQKQLEDTVDVEVEEVAEVNTFHDLLAGGIAGSASVIVGHPFDTMKVRMQTNGSIGGSLMSANAVKGLFRGMAPPLGAAGLVNALVFSSYGWSNRMWDQYYGTEEEQKNQSKEEEGFKFNWKAYWCGCFAGLAQTFVLTPTEHIKCRLQVQQSNGGGAAAAATTVYKGPRDAAAQIVKSHGLKGLYRGFHITAWREVPAFGLYFTSYDYLKDAISKQLAQRNMDQPWIASGISGGVSGCLTWLVVYPTDVIKSRIQTQSLNCAKGIITTGKEIYREGGVRLLFRGLGITLLRAFPVNGVIFPVYEFALLQLTGGDQMLD